MADGCPLCVFIVGRLKEHRTRRPGEPAFSSYTIINVDPYREAFPESRNLATHDPDIHFGRHLRGDILAVKSCCTARTYCLATLGPPPAVCGA